MKLMKYYFLVLACWLSIGAAWGQCKPDPLPPDGCTFNAYDATTGQLITAFCVGRSVFFRPCDSRGSIPANLQFYGVVSGVLPNPLPPNGTGCPTNTNGPTPYIYTPTRADVGIVTVEELTNSNPPPAAGVFYTRTYQVYDTPPPAFTVAPCPNGYVRVTITDTNYDTYRVDVGTSSQTVNRGSLPVPALVGSATAVVVTGKYTANGLCEGTSSQPIPTLAPPQIPSFTSLTLDAPLPGGTATLAVGNLPTGYLYTLQRADATVPSGYRNVTNVLANSTTIPLLGAVSGCYRLRRTDFCRFDSAFSEVICTVSLAGNSTLNRNQLLLTDAGSPGTTYTVTRDGPPITAYTVIPGGLEDANVQCGNTYNYRVTALQPGGGRSISNPVSILTKSTIPPPQPRLIASFDPNDVVELTPLLSPSPALPTGSSLRYSRSAGVTVVPDFRSATTARVQRDSTSVADLLLAPPCYSVIQTDVCGNVSVPSPPACPALLTVAAANADGSTAALSWTSFYGPDPSQPASYTLQRLAADGTVLSNVAVTGNSYTDLAAPTDRQILRYRLRISGAGLPVGTFSYSNRASLTRQLSLRMPTAFTPNGDGLNDVLEVKGKYLQNYLFVVVDRNGQEVFRGTQRSEVWDGSIQGHAPVLGAYVWRFQQDGEDGKRFTATGAVTLLK